MAAGDQEEIAWLNLFIAFFDRVGSDSQPIGMHSRVQSSSGSGRKWQISTGGGWDPMWRGDGKELFYLDGNKLMVVEVNGDRESFQPGIPRALFEARVPPTGLRNRYVVAADGKRFLVNTVVDEPERASFHVILNWPALLKH